MMGQMFGMTHTYKLSSISITVIAVVIVVVGSSKGRSSNVLKPFPFPEAFFQRTKFMSKQMTYYNWNQ